MKIQTGLAPMGDVKPVEGQWVDFVVENDRVMFSVQIGSDGRSLEIRACDTVKVNGVLYSTHILVSPNVSNSITVSTKPYEPYT